MSRVIFLLLTTLFFLADWAKSQEILFDTRLDYRDGGEPRSIFCADFNQDGFPDIALANETTNELSILLNDGRGYFLESVAYQAGIMPMSVFSQDLDGDSDNDLVVANYLSQDLFIFVNDGQGIFTQSNQLPLGSRPYSVVVADFNGDQENDIAASLDDLATISLFLNLGGGTFGTAISYPVGEKPRCVIARDLNGDEDDDLIVANWLSNSVSILINSGDGSFGSAVDYVVGERPLSVYSADFDDDGDTDLATANEYSDDVSILFNNGDGSFAQAISYNLGWRSYPWSISSADLDNDNDADLAVATRHYKLLCLFNDGSGTFQMAEDSYGLNGRYSIFLTDLDLDGDADLATGGGWHAGVLHNRGNGTFPSVTVLPFNNPKGTSAQDFDGDGNEDLAVVEQDLEGVSVLLGNGDGSFQSAGSYGVDDSPWYVFSADVNGDSNLDLVTSNQHYSTISVLLNNGDGTFQPVLEFDALPILGSIYLADLDGDEDNDLTFTYKTSQGYSYCCAIGLMFNDGNGNFGPPTSCFMFGSWTYPGYVVAADLDGDQDNDLAGVCRGGDLALAILINDGYGTFETASVYEVHDPVTLVAADLDGDTDNDLAVAYCGTEVETDDLRVYLNDGDGSFHQSGDYAVPIAPSSVVADDLDRDGDIDLAVACQDNCVAVWSNQGDGSFQRQALFDYGTGWYPIWLTGADFDGDGDVDLVTSNYYSVDITILFNLTNTYYILGDANGDSLVDVGDVVFLVSYLYRSGPAPDPLWVGDCNCDDIVDVGDIVSLVSYLYRGGPPPSC